MSKEFFDQEVPEVVSTWWAEMQQHLYEGNVASGFWDDSENPLIVPTKLALIHSEVSEAMEGHRKNLKDDHLPAFDQLDVELADVVVRVIDLCEARGVNILELMLMKVKYNHERADHKKDFRETASNGKRY